MASHSVSLIDFYSLESGMATEFRRLLNTLQHPGHEQELKTVLITSSMLSEGKSTISAFLAVTAAKKGLKTLIVDCDLRRPTQHKLFNLPRAGGLAEVLSDGAAPKNAIKKTSLDKLDVITAGKAISNPAEVFDAPAIGRMLAELKFYYDIIVIDSAPVIPVSDPMLLAPEVDGVLLVVMAGATQRNVILRAKEILAGATNRLLGVVINNAEGSLPYYYDHGYYGYQYEQKPPGVGKPSSPKDSQAPVRASESGKPSDKPDKLDKKTDSRPGNIIPR